MSLGDETFGCLKPQVGWWDSQNFMGGHWWLKMVSTTKPKELGRVHWDIQPDPQHGSISPFSYRGSGLSVVIWSWWSLSI